MIHQLNIYGKDKVQVAIERLKTFEPPEGYFLAFSGGKDSVVIKALADMAGVKYDAHYQLTSVDPPELVRFVKSFPDVIVDKPRYPDNYKNPKLAGKQITMWNLIPEKTMPPTMIVRYCCNALKEQGGKGRMVITGVRWDESTKRKRNQGEVTVMSLKKSVKNALVDSGNFAANTKAGVVLNNDNADSRRMIEQCYKETKTVVNPIIDWTTEDVWEFIHEYEVPYCKLYGEGFKRLGCVGCPMSGQNGMKRDFKRFPKYKQMYLNAFERMLAEREKRGNPSDWETAKEVMYWWMGD